MSATKTKAKKFAKDLKQVQDHYLDYPYPARDPKVEKDGIMRMQGDFLSEINHHLYNGKKDFNGFRVLVAGGGTGDSAIWLAKQLMEHKDTEVVYLDFSKASMAIAKERAKYHDINNITWIEDSILNIPDMKLGKFNHVNCVGVLHHLKDPDLGLKILADTLEDDGGMFIMVYAQYGRTALYQIQDLLRRINVGVTNRQEEVNHSWEVLNSLPVTNWFKRGEDLLQDHKLFGDIGLYDMFLHKQDRAYTIPQLYEFVEKAGLNLVQFTDPYTRAVLNIDSYFKDSPTKERIAQLPIREQQAICEIMGGNLIKHSVYISKKPNSSANFADLDNVPFTHCSNNLCNEIHDYIDSNEAHVMNKITSYSITDSLNRQLNMQLAILPHTKYLFKHMESGELSFKEIFEKTRKDSGSNASDSELLQEFLYNLAALYTTGAALLRHKSIPAFRDFADYKPEKK